MLSNIGNEIRRSRAEKARDLEYLYESVLDDTEDELMDVIPESSTVIEESAEEMEEINKFLDGITLEAADDDMEIERILSSESNMTFEQMIGIE